MSKSGFLIAIEGAEESVVSTQAKLLTERLLSTGYSVTHIQATDKSSAGGYFVNEYEAAKFAELDIHKPYTPVVFYALNHFAVSKLLMQSLKQKQIVICDQYVLTNYLTNLSASTNASEFFDWITSLEHTMLGLPRADFSFVIEGKKTRAATTLQTKIPDSSYVVIGNTSESFSGAHSLIWETLSQLLKDRGITAGETAGPAEQSDSKPSKGIPTNDNREYRTTLSKLAVQTLRQTIQNIGIEVALEVHETEGVYVPESFDTDTKKHHTDVFNTLTSNRKKLQIILKKTDTDAIANQICHQLTPLSALQDCVMSFSLRAADILTSVLLRSDISELQSLAMTMRTQYKLTKLVPKADYDSTEFNIQPLKGRSDQSVTLVRYFPKNELDLVSATLFSSSTLSDHELTNVTSELPYKTKGQVVRERANNTLQTSRLPLYVFDVLIDEATRDSLLQVSVGELDSQQRTLHYGFSYPKQINNPESEALYDECYEISFQAYQTLFEAGYKDEAQYCTLFGHKNRMRLTLTLGEVRRLQSYSHTSECSKKFRTFCSRIITEVKNAHPLIGASLDT